MEANRFLPLEPRSIAFCVLPPGEIGYEVHTIAAWHELYRERQNKRTGRNGCLFGDGYEGYDKLMTRAYAGSCGPIS